MMVRKMGVLRPGRVSDAVLGLAETYRTRITCLQNSGPRKDGW